MNITYLRSSSFGSWEFCQQKYFIAFNLGIDDASNRSAEKGTVCHKVLEILAKVKQAKINKEKIIQDEIVGPVEVPEDLLLETCLSNEEVDFVNSTRGNSSIYKPEHKLKNGHRRYGVELVDRLILPIFQYYRDRSIHKWYPQDYKDCVNWVWMALDYNDGQYDPRKQDIVSPELRFDITIDKPWAKYDYEIDGKKVQGQLSFKGTIDLIVKNPCGYEIIDYKTGQRKNWAKGYVKDFSHFEKDPQLILYYYAVRTLFPDIKNVIINIFWIRDGGVFSLCFDDGYLDKAEILLARQFNEIKRSVKPKMCSPNQTDFKCTRLCNFYKDKFEGSDKNICREIFDYVKLYGIEAAEKKFKKEGHSVSDYKAPGE